LAGNVIPIYQHRQLLTFWFTVCSGPWQVMLKQADGSYACVAESEARFTLGQVIPLVTRMHLLYFVSALLCVWGKKILTSFKLVGPAMQFLFFQAKEELLRVIGLQEEEGKLT